MIESEKESGIMYMIKDTLLLRRSGGTDLPSSVKATAGVISLLLPLAGIFHRRTS